MEIQSLVTENCLKTIQECVKNRAFLVDDLLKDELCELAYDATNFINIPSSEFKERFN